MSALPYAMPRDLSCSGCGYGIVVRTRLPERCPMCGSAGWASRTAGPRPPFTLAPAARRQPRPAATR